DLAAPADHAHSFALADELTHHCLPKCCCPKDNVQFALHQPLRRRVMRIPVALSPTPRIILARAASSHSDAGSSSADPSREHCFAGHSLRSAGHHAIGGGFS